MKLHKSNQSIFLQIYKNYFCRMYLLPNFLMMTDSSPKKMVGLSKLHQTLPTIIKTKFNSIMLINALVYSKNGTKKNLQYLIASSYYLFFFLPLFLELGSASCSSAFCSASSIANCNITQMKKDNVWLDLNLSEEAFPRL